MNTRLKEIQEKVASAKLDGFVSFNPSNIFYLTGFFAENSFIFVSGKNRVLVVPELLYPSVRSHPQQQIGNPPLQIKIFKSYKDFFKQCNAKKIGFESTISYRYFKNLQKIPGIKLKNCDNLIENMRLIKNKDEISKIKIACKISKRAVKFAENRIKTGMTEKKLADELEYFLRRNGAEKSSFDVIVASGKNSAKPHHRPTGRKFQKNDGVLIDLGCVYEGYNSDLTRTFFLGRINTYIKKVFNVVQEAQCRAIGAAKAGVACTKIDFTVRDFINKNGFKKYFIHSTGHGIGIDIHEEPYLSVKSKTILEKGMVMTVEPGIYIQNKFGVRIEDTILVTKNGCEVLTK